MTPTLTQQEIAYKIIECTDTNLFLTGRAGTGKTTFLRSLKERLPKRMVVLAPTGIAAINAQGVTIHSFFQLDFGPLVPETTSRRPKKYTFRKHKIQLIRSLDLIVIDEISMVRADVLDAIDSTLRQFRDRSRPFGGVQMLLIGDMQQLAPVAREDEWRLLSPYYATPYFFSCQALHHSDFVTIELHHVYRQSDSVFLDILNKVRENNIDEETLSLLNTRYLPDFKPDKNEGFIHLCTHNKQADAINQQELVELQTPLVTFDATVEGDFPEYSYPTENHLQLKVGAQVMFIKNDSSQSKAYYNGMIGELMCVDAATGRFEDDVIKVRCHDSGKILSVQREEWENTRYDLDPKTKDIKSTVIGKFIQYPLKPAWAITIHKSQGLTFDKAIIDVQHSFAHGQTYVALSRCKTLHGLVLSSPVPRYSIINDQKVEEFTHDPRHQEPSEKRLSQMEQQYFVRIADELFSLQQLRYCFTDMLHFQREHFSHQMPKTFAEWNEASQRLKELESISVRFHNQYIHLINEITLSSVSLNSSTAISNNPLQLQDRFKKGAEYFEEQLIFIHRLLKKLQLNTDNHQIRARRDYIVSSMTETYQLKVQLLHYVRHNGLHIQDFLKFKARVSLMLEDKDNSKLKRCRD